jgi:dipeptidyl aminopeptidase/acylaminoacyl peptidase
MRLLRRVLPFTFICLCLLIPPGAWGQQPRQALMPEDLFKIEEISEIQAAPSGDVFAFTRKLSLVSESGQPRTGFTRSQVWVQPFDGGAATTVQADSSIDTGYRSLSWSPDGTRLAMLFTKGDDSFRLCVWEKATGHVAKFTEHPLTLASPLTWLDDSHLVAIMELSPLVLGAKAAMREWQRQQEGRTAAVNVLESGGSGEPMKRPQYEFALVLMDVNTGAVRTLSQAPWFRDIRVSPDDRHVAFLKEDDMHELEAAFSAGYHFAMTDAIGRSMFDDKSGATFVRPGSFQWSLDGRAFVFLGTTGSDKTVHVFRGLVGGGIDVVPLAGDTIARKVAWAAGGRLIVAAERENKIDGKPTKRLDWWMILPGGVPINLTEKLTATPGELLPVSDGKALVGVAEGDLWRLDVESGAWTNLTAMFNPNAGQVIWPTNETPNCTRQRVIVVSVPNGSLTDFYKVDIQSGSISQLNKPSDSARLGAYSPESETAVFAASDPKGTSLTAAHGQSMRSVAKVNQFLRDIMAGECRSITYRSLDSKELKGWIILPPKYQPGKRYPLVTWVYAGDTYGDSESSYCHIDVSAQFNMQLLAARGYAVLVPSMPLLPEPDGENNSPSDPYFELMKGVMPAIDKVIDLGIADPKRLAVSGHSFGGYSTMGLIEQTNRFQAAVADAGASNLVDFYGTFNWNVRYVSPPYYDGLNSAVYWAEMGQGRMGTPPWKDPGRYTRNSPITYVDRVQTPLLVIHGDMDGLVPIQQSEEFFTALRRQGKRARFVRYWGEGHFLKSPANIRDYWQQVYAWLDEFCDVSRDNVGNLVFDGDHVKSRNGGPPLRAEDFARFNDIELESHPWVKKTQPAAQ